MPLDENPYDVLDVERSASAKELKRAFYKKVRSHPPEHDPERYQDVVDAYEMLKKHPRHQSSSRRSNRKKRGASSRKKREASSQNEERPAQVDQQAEQRAQPGRRTRGQGDGSAGSGSEEDGSSSGIPTWVVLIAGAFILLFLLIMAL
jgi:DnaJ-class molecular chaperone